MRRKGEKNFLCIYVYVIFPKVGKMLKDKKKKKKKILRKDKAIYSSEIWIYREREIMSKVLGYFCFKR